jgi:RimJ/RimL family protein N-acetyltransferase
VSTAIAIRPLAASDADVFRRLRLEQVELEPKTFAESSDEIRALSLEATAQRLAAPADESYVMGAFDGDELIGTAGCFRLREGKTRHKGRLWGVYVTPAFRRRGVGRALLEAVVRKAGDIAGMEQLTLAVALPQLAARRLYESLRFEVYGTERRALKVGFEYVDEHLMMLRLRTNDERPMTDD